MVYPEILRFIVATGIIILTTIVLTPITYDMWYHNLREQINTQTNLGHELLFAGDLMFSEFMILGLVIAGVVFAYGFALAARKGVQSTYEETEA